MCLLPLDRVMADEALKCFESLLETVPGWIADLEGILKTAAERQEEILFASQVSHTFRCLVVPAWKT